MSEKNKELAISLALILVIALMAVGFLYFLQKKDGQELKEGEPTEEEKKEALEALSAPEDSESEMTEEEKKRVLENLSAPEDIELTIEEKKKILDALGAPISN